MSLNWVLSEILDGMLLVEQADGVCGSGPGDARQSASPAQKQGAPAPVWGADA